jgi:Fur family ferric uptake transcriptional regulator
MTVSQDTAKASVRGRVHETFETYLTKLGLRQTKQRRIILDAVMMLGPHVDADAIASEAKKMDKSIGLATVYRTLQLMTESGVLTERQFGKERARFEINYPHQEHHDHLICSDCGAIFEFMDPELERLQVQIAQRIGFQLRDHRMELFGNCMNKENCERRNN